MFIPEHPPQSPGAPRETAQEYLDRIGAGQSAIDSFVGQMEAAFKASMAGAAEAMIAAGVPPEQVVQMARAFATATPDVRAQVLALLINSDAAPLSLQSET